jgi:hypothetical protein
LTKRVEPISVQYKANGPRGQAKSSDWTCVSTVLSLVAYVLHAPSTPMAKLSLQFSLTTDLHVFFTFILNGPLLHTFNPLFYLVRALPAS